ncbi:MAG: DUF4105 domain-containing protein [Paludibacteraceae bacterium]|nr:DUF4105 domain-containing protein [Paludibacteraceae bacterium]
MSKLCKIFALILLFFFPFYAFGQDSLSVAERNAAQGFNDTIDRLAPDFVTVSLCIADPTTAREDALGTSGHAFLRLQCPVFNLDYCFSYEGERVNDNLYRYLSGQTKMGMFAIPTAEYLEDYRRWNRSVHEYQLALPPDAEQRLWEIMDNHITNGISLRQDLNKYGCAITVVRFVKQALAGIPIVYAPDEDLEYMTRREIGYRSMANHPWLRLTSMIFTDNKADDTLPIDEKLIIPADLANVWEHATLDGKPFATYIGDAVEGAPLDESRPWLTPMIVAILILLITIGFAFTKYPYWDWVLLGGQALFGCVLIFLWIIMREFGGSAYILMALFNPLPLIFWHWRSYWALPYAVLLLIGIIVHACWPHMLIDPALLMLAVAYVVLFAKEKIINLKS